MKLHLNLVINRFAAKDDFLVHIGGINMLAVAINFGNISVLHNTVLRTVLPLPLNKNFD